MGLNLEYDDGQTLLEEDEKDGLLISTITTRAELDEFEQQNIEDALVWTMKRRFKLEEILKESYVKQVHRRMFGEVWA